MTSNGGHFYCSIVLMTFAGTPAIRLFSGIFLVTTAPAAITHPAPMVTPGITETLAPNQQLFPTLIGKAFLVLDFFLYNSMDDSLYKTHKKDQ